MPFAGFADFDACLAHMTKPKSEGGGGYDEETARKVCGTLQAQAEGKAKESFSWVGDIKSVPGVQNLIRGEALHPLKTVHPEEWPSVRVYLEEELQKSAHTLAGKPLLLDHSMLIDGEVTGAQYEDGAIEYVAQVKDPRILGLIEDGTIKHCSVEFEWKSLEQVNGIAPRGLNFTGLSLLKNFAPGDPLSTVELVEVWEGIVKQLKEAKNVRRGGNPGTSTAKEQAEPQEFILYLIHDPAAFLEERFSTAWIDLENGIQAIYGRLREDPENPQPMALLFMKAKGWTLEKMQGWLQDHSQYLRQSQPAAAAPAGIQSVSPTPPTVQEGRKMKEKSKFKTLEGRVTFLETLQRLKEQDAELTEEEIKQKIAALTKQMEELRNKLYPESPLSEEEKTAVQTQIDVLYAEIQAYEQALTAKIAGQATPAPAATEQPTGEIAQEAEWDTEYINDLPDSAFAVIASGGEKDEQGKTVPRTLRKLPYKNAQGNVDLPHLRNALARLNQIEPASLRPAAKKKLCAAARSEKAEDLVSEFCGEEPETATEQQGDQEPEKDEHGCIVGKEKWDPETEKCVPIATEQQEPEKDEHGCIIGKERWDPDQEKCVSIATEQQGGGEPKTDRQRFMDHYGLTEEQMASVLEWIGEDVYKLLPEPGTKRQQQAAEKKGLGEAIIEPSESQPSDLISKEKIRAVLPPWVAVKSSLGLKRLVEDIQRVLRES